MTGSVALFSPNSRGVAKEEAPANPVVVYEVAGTIRRLSTYREKGLQHLEIKAGIRLWSYKGGDANHRSWLRSDCLSGVGEA